MEYSYVLYGYIIIVIYCLIILIYKYIYIFQSKMNSCKKNKLINENNNDILINDYSNDKLLNEVLDTTYCQAINKKHSFNNIEKLHNGIYTYHCNICKKIYVNQNK